MNDISQDNWPKINWMEHYNVLMFTQIDSTHLEAQRLAKTQAIGNFVIWALQQTAGRGKIGRTWESPEGNLYFSFLLRQSHQISEVSQLTFTTAVAVGEALRPYLSPGAQLTYKWPNDIMIDGKKCGGILLESISDAGSHLSHSLIVSIGINIKSHPEIQGLFAATNLSSHSTTETHLLTPDHLLCACVDSFDQWYRQWIYMGFEPIRLSWRNAAHHLGQAITVHQGNERISGIFTDIAEDGSLLLQVPGGHHRTICAGEIFAQPVARPMVR